MVSKGNASRLLPLAAMAPKGANGHNCDPISFIFGFLIALEGFRNEPEWMMGLVREIAEEPNEASRQAFRNLTQIIPVGNLEL